MREGTITFALCVCLCIGFIESINAQVPGRIKYIPALTFEDVERLVIDTFIANECFEVPPEGINISGQVGNNASLAYFSEGQQALGMESGIVIANANVTQFQGGNTATGVGDQLNLPGDANLSLIEAHYGGTIGGFPGGGMGDVATFDAGFIEFDFIPTSEEVTFTYVFASEEYCDFVASFFNDKFGIFLSGPGITSDQAPFVLAGQPAINIAEFVDSNGAIENVSINNINNSLNPQFYVDNNIANTITGGDCLLANPANNPHTQLSQFDGWTVPMEASYDQLQICEKYRVRIVVADGSDRIFGSAVYLQSSSFNAAEGAGITEITFGDTGETYTYESCGDSIALVEFTRQEVEGTDNFADINIPIEVTGDATFGLDYCTDLPIFGDIDLGPFGAYHEIVVKGDDEMEGSEFINISIQNPCFCEPELYELEIIDVPPIEVRPLVGDTACFNGMRDLRAIIEGGGFPSVDREDPPAEFEYYWSDDSGVISTNAIHTVDISAAGSYTYYLEVGDGCGGSHFDTVNFVTSGIPDAELEGVFAVCDESPTAILDLTLVGEGPWTLGYNLDGIPQDPIVITDPNFEFEVSEIGEYEITRIDGPNCGRDVEGLAVVSNQSFTLDVMPTPTLCSDSEDGMLMATVSDGMGTYEYLWSDDDGQITDMATGLAPGEYTVTVTDMLGCTQEFTAEVPAAAVVNVTPALVSGTTCASPNSGEASADGDGGAGGYTYEWLDGAGSPVGTGAVIDGLAAGVYDVVVTDDNGCEGMASVTIPSDVNTPDAIAENAVIDCNNMQVDINTLGTSLGAEFEYTWTVNTGGGSVNSDPDLPMASISQAGTYTLTVINTTNGCSATAPFEVIDNTEDPTADAGSGFDCISSDVQLGGPGMETGANISYVWTSVSGGAIQGAADIQNPTVSDAGIYEVTVINNDNGCEATSQVEVSVNPEASITAPESIDCRGDGTVTLSGSDQGTGTSYAWTASNGGVIVSDGSTLNPIVSAAGTYTLTVTNAAGCSVEMPTQVEDITSVVVADPGQAGQIDCNVGDIALGGPNTSTGGNFNYEWQIDLTAGGTSSASTQNISATEGGTYTLLVTNNDNGCTAMEQVVIQEDTNDPIVSIGNPQLLTCEEDSQVLSSAGSSTNGDFTYTWTTSGGNIVSSQNDQDVTVDDPGTYTLTIVNNANGCESFDSVVVEEDAIFPTVIVATPLDIDCDNTQVLLDGSASDSGAGIEYTWTDVNNVVVGNTASIQVDAAGQYTLEVNNTNTGCTETDPVIVNDLREDPVADPGIEQTLDCANMMLTLGGNNTSTGAEFSYAWTLTGSSFTSTDANPQISEGGEYTLVVTNSTNQCTATESVMIAEDMLDPDINIDVTGVITCEDPIQTLESTGSSTGPEFTYEWTGPMGFESDLENPEITLSGDYQLVITNTANMCVVTDDITVDEDAEFPEIAIEAPGVVNCANTIIDLSGLGSEEGNDIEYIWVASNGGVIEDDEDSLSPEISAAGTYTLTVSNVATGCSRSLEVEVTDDFEEPTAMVNQDLSFGCQDTELAISGAGSSTGANIEYQWTPGQGNISGPTDQLDSQIDQPGDYTLLVTNTDNGCTAEASFVVTPDEELPEIVIEEPLIITCDRDMVLIDASASDTGSDLIYEWTKDGDVYSPTDEGSFMVDQPGEYTLTITNTDNGCISMGTTVVEENRIDPIAEAGDGIILNCRDMMLNLDADGSSTGDDFAYSWTAANGGNIVSGSDTDEPLIDEPGTYILTVTNTVTGCEMTDEVPVLRNDFVPEIEVEDIATLNCRDEVIMIDASDSDQGAIYELEWEVIGTGNIESGETTLTPMIDEPGTYVLTIINTDNFCENTIELIVEQDIDQPLAEILPPDMLTCAEISVPLLGDGSSQGSEFSYEWTSSNGGSFVGATNSIDAMVDQPGTYELLVVNTENFCENSFAIIVEQDIDPPTAVSGSVQEVTCENLEAILSGVGSSVGPEFEYNWTPLGSGVIVSGDNTLTPTVNAPGEYQLTVINTNNGCISESTQSVVSNDIFPQDAPPVPAVLTCGVIEQVLAGTGNPGLDYEWSTNNGNIVGATSSSEIMIDEPGIYVMTITDIANGCSTPYEIEVFEDIEPPMVDAGPTSTLTCEETIVALAGSGSEGSNYTYEWTTTDGAISGDIDQLEAFATSAGTYTLTIFNTDNECVSSDNVNIGIDPNVPSDINAEAIPPNCFGDPGAIDFVSIDGGTGPFEYSIDGGNNFTDESLFMNLTPGQSYDLFIQDANGCIVQEELDIPAVDSLSVQVSDPIVEIELGEAFDITAFLSIPESEIVSITWSPSTGLSCDDCLNPQATPGNSINYNVVVVSENGCIDEADVQFKVDRSIDIYIPNAFSPHNLDGVNDIFAPLGKPNLIATVVDFQVFDRWGDQVFIDRDFPLNEPGRGWKGDFRDEKMQPGVFVYYVVLEFVDGSTELFEGDVTLMD